MKKMYLMLSYILCLVLLVGSVSAIKDFEIKEAVKNLVADEGSSVTFYLLVNNTGDEATNTIVLNSTNLGDGFSHKMSIPTVTVQSIAVNQSVNKSITFSVPTNQYAGPYSGTMLAEMLGTAVTDSVLINLDINTKESLTASSTSPTVVKGVANNVEVTLANTGNVDLLGTTYNILELVKIDDPGKIIPFVHTGSVNLLYSTSEKIDMAVNVGPSLPAGTYRGTLTINYGSGKVLDHTIQIDVVEENKQVTVTEATQTAHLVRTIASGESDTVTMKIKNTGNVDLADVVISSDVLTSGVYKLTINPADIIPNSITSLTTGEERSISITVRRPSDSETTTGTLVYTGLLNISATGVATVTTPLSAELRDPIKSISFSDIDIGAANQARNVTVIGDFTITNTGDLDLASIVLTPTGFNSKYDFQITGGVQTNLAIGQSMIVSYSVKIPVDQDAGRSRIGSIKFTSDMVNETRDAFVTTETNLRIREVELKLDDDGYDTVCGNDEYSCDDFDIQPGKKLTVRVTLKNTLSKGEKTSDNRMENVRFSVTILGIDGEDEDDLDERSGEFKINANNDESDTVTFSLPDKLPDRESFTMEITAEASVDNGPDFELPETAVMELVYDREDNDVRIIDAHFTENSLACSRETSLQVTIANFGNDDIDEARIVVFSDDLDILDRTTDDISLASDPFDSDNEFDATYRITVPRNYNGNSANFIVWAYHGNSDSEHTDDLEDYQKELTLSIGPCTEGGSVTTTRSVTTTTRPTTVVTFVPPTYVDGGDNQFDSTEIPFTETPTYIALLVLVNIVVIGLLVVFIVRAFKK